MDNKPLLISMEEASHCLGISRSMIYKIKSTDKTFPVVVLGKRILVNQEKLVSWINERTAQDM